MLKSDRKKIEKLKARNWILFFIIVFISVIYMSDKNECEYYQSEYFDAESQLESKNQLIEKLTLQIQELKTPKKVKVAKKKETPKKLKKVIIPDTLTVVKIDTLKDSKLDSIEIKADTL